jgi:acyl-CoA synthetase (AMP-forming)/AMP-acid ligase II
MDAAPSVREGFPIVIEDTTLGKVIGACFTSADPGSTDPELTGSGLFDRLLRVFKDELPYYMVPSLYFLFDRFPELPSGKTDKNCIVKQARERLSASEAGATRFVCYEVDQQKVVPA